VLRLPVSLVCPRLNFQISIYTPYRMAQVVMLVTYLRRCIVQFSVGILTILLEDFIVSFRIAPYSMSQPFPSTACPFHSPVRLSSDEER
jgi:hypothetical protein